MLKHVSIIGEGAVLVELYFSTLNKNKMKQTNK